MTVSGERGPRALAVRLEPAEPRLSDTMELRLALTGPDDPERPALDLTAFDVREDRALPLRIAGGRPVHEWVYRLEARDSGAHVLGPFDVGGVEAEPLRFDVTSVVPADREPSLDALRGPAGPVEAEPDAAAPWWPWAAAAAALALLFVLLRRRRAAPPAPVLTPTELAARELAALLADDPLARGAFSEFYSELTFVVRRYIERTTGIRAPELTTPEFLRQCNDMPKLGAFLEAADLVKFAAVRPGREEIDRSVARAREFVGL